MRNTRSQETDRGELLAALEGAVGDRDGARVLRGEVGGGQLDHLAGADEQHLDLGQVLEQLPGQSHRGGESHHGGRG